jgi:hypothetical protein
MPLTFQVTEAFKQVGADLLFGKVLADYLSLLSTRLTLYVMGRVQNGFVWIALLIANIYLTVYLGIVGMAFGLFVGGYFLRWLEPHYYVQALGWQHVANFAVLLPVQLLLHPILSAHVLAQQASIFPLVLSGFVTSVWFWLYAGSGFLLKAARRFDVGFDWFNRKVDIEKKPLQAIGLVAGALLAIAYWGFVYLRR